MNGMGQPWLFAFKTKDKERKPKADGSKPGRAGHPSVRPAFLCRVKISAAESAERVHFFEAAEHRALP